MRKHVDYFRFISLWSYIGSASFRALVERRALTVVYKPKVFGAPFYIWRGEPFWGQDRLDLLEAAVVADRTPFEYRDP